jgi:hypothetical protein
VRKATACLKDLQRGVNECPLIEILGNSVNRVGAGSGASSAPPQSHVPMGPVEFGPGPVGCPTTTNRHLRPETLVPREKDRPYWGMRPVAFGQIGL